jgi:hypothetical protein
MDMTRMTSWLLDTKFARTIVEASSKPATIGSFRPTLGVRKHPAQQHPDRCGNVRHDREEAGLQPVHVPLCSKIGRKPGQKENERRIAAELADRSAEDLPLG